MHASRFLVTGLLLASAVIVVGAQEQRPAGFGRASPEFIFTHLLSKSVLQDELKMTAAQREKLKIISDKKAELSKQRALAMKEAARGGADLFKQVSDSYRDLTDKMEAESKKGIEDSLTAEQNKRLNQIKRQMGGVRAFLDEDNAKALGLTESQKDKIKTIFERYNADLTEVMKAVSPLQDGKLVFGKVDKEKMEANQKKREMLTKSTMDSIEEMLSAEQRKTWKELLGEPFDLSKLLSTPSNARPRTKN